MIIKGGSRSAPSQLGKHLLRTDTNERVEILQLQSPAGNLTEALRDWQFLSAGTKGTKGLYHANIDPDARYRMTPEQWLRSVNVLEEKLGFQSQPRAVVLHEKYGRQHIHVVWQRTDVETMTLRSDSQNYRRHEEASLALEQEFGHEHVPGKHAKRDREKQPDLPKSEFTHAEWQQTVRTGLDPRDRKDIITGLYENCENGNAFRSALEAESYVLAQGDRRDYVIVDRDGEIHSLGRQIKGIKAKDLREFMEDIDRDKLPTAEEARARQTQQQRESEPDLQPVSDEISAIEKAVSARHLEEAQRQHIAQTDERAQTAAIYGLDFKDKLGQLDALKQAERDRYQRESRKTAPSGIAGWFSALRDLFRPEIAVEKSRQKKEAAEAFDRKLEQKREDYIRQLEAENQSGLADLGQHHAQQRREQSTRHDEERARYIREEEAAQRLIKELEDERARHMEERRVRDGPDRQPPR